MKEAEDLVGLIILIQGICCRFNNQQQATWSVVRVKKRVFLFVQLKYVTVDKYYEEFRALAMAVETCDKTFVKLCVVESELMLTGMNKEVNKTMMDSADKPVLDAAIKIFREKILALMLLNGANYQQCCKMRNVLSNQFTQRVDSYPMVIEGAILLLNNYKIMRVRQPAAGHPDEEEVASV